MTERRRAEEALREADRRKDEFLAMLAHELRNPLSAVSNAVLLIQTSWRCEHAEWAKEVIAQQVRHLARMIDDLLDVSRITRGKIQLRREPHDLAPILRRAVESVRPLIEARRHELTTTIAPGPLRLEADATRLEQILTNLLTNAAKYTDEGGRIVLTARREGDEHLITVRDNGVGIAPEMLPRVFDPFTRAEQTIDRSQGGLGIGLTLARRLAQMHGGDIGAASRGRGCGSEFTLRLPALRALGAVFPAPGRMSRRRRRGPASSWWTTTCNRPAAWPASWSCPVTPSGRPSTAPTPWRPRGSTAPTWCSWTSACPAWTATRSPRSSARPAPPATP
jgi:signal transduction histidine kinase